MRYNDWRSVDLASTTAFTPSEPVSVVVPYFEAPAALALTLAGLEAQTYPRDLFEVVIVDDGSQTPLAAPPSPLCVRTVHQEDRGYGLARARNTGVRAARFDIVVFLDADMITEAGWLEAHARWHHAVADALTLGFYARVSAAGLTAEMVRDRTGSVDDLLANRDIDPPWIERHMVRTEGFTSRHDDLFRAVSGGNLGIRRDFCHAVGGFDESFTRFGTEDVELGYRAYTRGGLLVPVPDAFAWHQGRWHEGRDHKDRGRQIQRGKISNLIAHRDFRRSSPGRCYAVPEYVVTIRAGDEPVERLLETAETVLADPVRDLVVRIDTSLLRDADAVAWLDNHLGPDPRVRIEADASVYAGLDQFPATPFHIDLPAGADIHRGLIARLRNTLGTNAAATYTLADGVDATISRAWALNRVRRTGRPVGDFGDVVTASAIRSRRAGRFRLRPQWNRAPFKPLRRLVPPFARVASEARHVRGLRTGWMFLRWLVRGIRWWIGHRPNEWPDAPPAPAPSHPAQEPGATIIPVGERARRVFPESAQQQNGMDAVPMDVALADTHREAATIDAPAAVLSDLPQLAVPALDTAVHNPIGWVRNVEPGGTALGPRKLLPPGATARRQTTGADRDALVHSHHVEDIRAFHSGAVERAGMLVRLAAMGVPVHLADHDPELAGLLGRDLYDLMASPEIRNADAAARELISIRMRRIALREHSLRGRAGQVRAAALGDAPDVECVSVLLATARPGFLPWAIDNIARQTYPRLELVVAMHGDGFDDDAVRRHLDRLTIPTTTLRVDGQRLLGDVLNAAAEAASGSLLAKMDDDDLYDAEHVWDLVLAHEYSGAEMVGKGVETIYLAGLDRTVQYRRLRVEAYSAHVGGSSQLVARQALCGVGGWRSLSVGEDRALTEDVVGAGGRVYRTHGAGYLPVRHGHCHAWQASDESFTANADVECPGWHPQLAGIAESPTHPGLALPTRQPQAGLR